MRYTVVLVTAPVDADDSLKGNAPDLVGRKVRLLAVLVVTSSPSVPQLVELQTNDSETDLDASMICAQELNLERGRDSLSFGAALRVLVHSRHVPDDRLAVPPRAVPTEPFLYLAPPPLPHLDG